MGDWPAAPTIGSLFTGARGLDKAVEMIFTGARTIWHSDIKPASVALLAHHHPDIPNLGDITTIDWSTVERPSIITGGFPCTDISAAGRQAGLIRQGDNTTRSGLWFHMHRAIAHLKPDLVVIENVRNITSAKADSDVEPCPRCMGGTDPAKYRPLRALGAVLGDLADIGYDARWTSLRASDVGYCHQRHRTFIIAHPAHT